MTRANMNKQPRGFHSKGKGSAIARKAGPLATMNMYSRLNEAGVGSTYKADIAAARLKYGQDTVDMYRSQHDYRYMPKGGGSY
jgi:hypothetical protein